MKVKSESEVTQSCPTLSDPMDCSPPGSSVHGIFQARVLEWGASVPWGVTLVLLKKQLSEGIVAHPPPVPLARLILITLFLVHQGEYVV